MKSRMPEIVEPKQLIQSRVLVKRARLTVKRGAARPSGITGVEGPNETGDEVGSDGIEDL